LSIPPRDPYVQHLGVDRRPSPRPSCPPPSLRLCASRNCCGCLSLPAGLSSPFHIRCPPARVDARSLGLAPSPLRTWAPPRRACSPPAPSPRLSHLACHAIRPRLRGPPPRPVAPALRAGRRVPLLLACSLPPRAVLGGCLASPISAPREHAFGLHLSLGVVLDGMLGRSHCEASSATRPLHAGYLRSPGAFGGSPRSQGCQSRPVVDSGGYAYGSEAGPTLSASAARLSPRALPPSAVRALLMPLRVNPRAPRASTSPPRSANRS